MIYYIMIREGRKIIKKEITSVKSHAHDVLKKDLEAFAKRNGKCTFLVLQN